MKPEQWIVNGEVGTSSKTIWAVMTGAVMKDSPNAWRDYDVPHDPDDLQRCVKLVFLVPEFKPRLPEVAEMFPKWKPLIREWDRLEKMCWEWLGYDYGTTEHKELYRKLYDFMQELQNNGK